MARQRGQFLENTFIRGLITETTALNFPTDACTETWNCVFDETGKITRRRGIDIEQSDTSFTSTYASGDAITTFTWDQVGASIQTEFEVLQTGYTLYFFDISSSTNIGTNKKSFSLDLRTYAADNLDSLIRVTRCSFTQGDGRLFVGNRYLKPLAVSYNSDTDVLEVEQITVQYRDIVGLNSGLAITERPSGTVGDFFTSAGGNDAHLYNLINQGWYVPTALEQWDTARTDLPSDVDLVSYYRVDDTDPFANNRVDAKSPGNSPAPKGHFILEVGVDDRQNVFTDDLGEVLSGASVIAEYNDVTVHNPNYSLLTGSVTAIGNFTNSANAFNDTTYEAGDAGCPDRAATSGYIGRDWGTATKIGIVTIISPEITGASRTTVSLATGGGNVDIALYGSNSAPANGTDGELLGTAVANEIADSFYPATYTIVSNDWTNSYRYVWVNFTNATTGLALSEIRMYEPLIEKQYPSEITWFNGRLFYGGYTDPELANVIFFSQVIERDEQYGYCYQTNDPTSELLSDAGAADGGSIQIPGMGKIAAMFPFQNQLLVIAANGTWVITGTGGGAFAATSFATRRLTTTGTEAGQSVVDVRGLPVWWAEDGIYTVQFDANYESATVKSLTEETIKEFITDIPRVNRKYVQGCYDRLNDVVYWVYDSSTSAQVAWTYDKVLCLNVKSQAFYPWSFTESTDNAQVINGLFYARSGDRTAPEAVKFVISYNTTTVNFAQEYQTSYKDWEDYASDVSSDVDDEMDYDSYFVTGYVLGGKGLTNFQSNYINVFMERETNASAFIQSQYMFSDSSSSGKWSTPQQAYRSTTVRGQNHLDIKRARVLLRGHGTAVQFRMYSETGKPFSIIGWGGDVSANQGM